MGEVRDSKHYISGKISVSYELNQSRSFKEFRTECIKEHCVSLSNQLYCIVAN